MKAISEIVPVQVQVKVIRVCISSINGNKQRWLSLGLSRLSQNERELQRVGKRKLQDDHRWTIMSRTRSRVRTASSSVFVKYDVGQVRPQTCSHLRARSQVDESKY